jgi:wobble nucleotide-excising tRNase
MISKFIRISDIGNFRRCMGGRDTTLNKLNLVHGYNGMGKSTLCSILRSLKSNDATIIKERKTLNGDGEPHVHIRLDGSTAEFKKGAWSANYPNLEIFDADFVTSNVYSGDAITHDHKRNLCTVVLGTEGVKLADVCVSLDLEEREAIKTLGAAEGEIKKLIDTKVSIDLFIGLAEDAEVDQKIKDKQGELQVIKDAAEIQAKAELSKVTLTAVPDNLVALLSKKLDDVSDDAEAKIRRHVDSHKMGEDGEAWLAEGLGYIVDEKCPMCAQALSTSPILKSLRAFFGQAYANFKAELATLNAAASAVGNDKAMIVVQRGIAGNDGLLEFWKRYAKAKVPSLSFDTRIQPAAVALKTPLDALLKKKLASPLECVEMTPEATAAVADWAKLKEQVAGYNAEVDAFNVAVATVKKGAESKSSAAIEQELKILTARKSRHTEGGMTAVKGYQDGVANKARIEEAKQKAKDKLAEYNETAIDAYRQSVNDMLMRFGATFRLSKVKIEYPGGKPRAGYALEIRGVEVDLGNENTPPGVPCFRNTLSSGDRSTLAFAFFMAQVTARTDLGGLVVVLDDPFTSLDEFRQTWTCYSIRKLAENAKQVVVLSHSLEFLRLIAKNCTGIPIKNLKLDFIAGDTEIVEFDLETATACNVDKNVMTLKSFYHGEDKNALAAIRAIRPALENYISGMAPDDCPKGDGGWLGEFLGKIDEADVASPLAIFKPDYDDMNFLNENTKAYHHNPETAPSINEPELRTWVEMCLKLIHRLPSI